jgi:hypothetical protein
MRQSGDWAQPAPLDIDQARTEVAPFVRDRRALEVWSPDFFANVISRIIPVAG